MKNLQASVKEVKQILTSQDILTFDFISDGGKKFTAIYADGICDKALLGDLVVKPLRIAKKEDEVLKVKLYLALPELKEGDDINSAVDEILEGNAVLFIDGEEKFLIIGLKKPPTRSVMEPPTQIVVRGPREGFVEEFKTNLGLIRKRIKTPNLQVKLLKVGKNSQTNVAICYIEGVCKKDVPEKIEQKLNEHIIDNIPDSSYIAELISKKPHSLFKRCASSEKPDIVCAKISEGRVAIVVDGSPMVLTAPYMIAEDFQSAEDYYVAPYRATIVRILRLISVLVGLLLPAFYISAQLFKMQLIPLKLLLKISSSVSGIPLSPSIEMFLTLFVLEVLNEASIRMPKYVGLALSIVGALVLGDTAVKAGIISTPAIIIIAFSAICLYTVPELIETTTTLRWLFLIGAGSFGTFGIVLALTYIICYLISEQSYGTPLLSPCAPLNLSDLKDSTVKMGLFSLYSRPNSLNTPNKTRLKRNAKGEKDGK